MVTRTSPQTAARASAPGLRRAGRALRAALLLALLAAALLAGGASPADAQTRNLYFLTLKRGIADATGSGEDLFDRLAAGGHGALVSKRAEDTVALELDIYNVATGRSGLGLGLEVIGYNRTWQMSDGEQVHLNAKGVLFTFKTVLRLGDLFPFFGAGLGNYYAQFDQAPGGPRIKDSPREVYNVRMGVRWLLGRYALLLEGGNTRARLPVITDIGRASVELGGAYANVGLGWVF